MVDGVRMDLGKMMAQKDTAVSGLTKGIEGLFKKYKACFSCLWQLPAFSKRSASQLQNHALSCCRTGGCLLQNRSEDVNVLLAGRFV